jgi:aldose 1-epimerase
MADAKARTFRWEKREENSILFFVLMAGGGALPEIEAWISPDYGSNLCRFSVNGHSVIDYDPLLLTSGDFTGTPLLYPTPNRVRDGVFSYRGRRYPQAKAGKTIYEHGLVHDEKWDWQKPAAREAYVEFGTSIDWKEGGQLYSAFPFRHELSMTFTLRSDGLEIAYKIDNFGDSEIPYGFGIHPYFQKLSGDAGTSLSVPASLVYAVTPDLLPTGRLLDAAGTVCDIRKARPVGDLDLDHVYTGLFGDRKARIAYSGMDFSLSLEPTEDLSQYVVYTPKGQACFCIENQSCSTDAHNLHDRGFVRESGLKFVPSGESRSGSVFYRIH